jgi:hypothetical protein
MSEWVKFHKELTLGAKRSMPRAARFIFMELSLLARPRGGTLDVRHDLPIVDAIHDTLGGGVRERKEVVDAWPRLTAAPAGDSPMVLVVEGEGWRRILIPSWEAYNTVDDARSRAQRYRDKKKDAAISGAYEPASRDASRDVTRDDRDASRDEPSRASRDVTLLDQRREEKRREASPSGSLPRAPATPAAEQEARHAHPAVVAIVEQLEAGRDMYPEPEAPRSVLADLAVRIGRAVRECPEAKRDGLTGVIAAQEAVAMARVWRSAHPGATIVGVLGQVETSVVRYILGDCRAGKRRKVQQRGAEGPSVGGEDFMENERAEIDRTMREHRASVTEDAERKKNAVDPSLLRNSLPKMAPRPPFAS